MSEPIYLEHGRKWSFVAAVEWPGLCRHARVAGDPAPGLLACGQRYGRAMPERALETFLERSAGRPVREPGRSHELWPPRWYVRYSAWHTIHHAWEIEDRRLDAPAP